MIKLETAREDEGSKSSLYETSKASLMLVSSLLS